MAVAFVLGLSTSALAQDAPEEGDDTSVDVQVSTDAGDQAEDEQAEMRDAQAQLSNPFGHTRPMFQGRLRARR